MWQRANDDSGFTLIELLAVVAIIGILAAIAIPRLLSARISAGDGAAKELLHTAQVTAITYGVFNGYTGMTPAALNSLEHSINITANGHAILANATPTVNGFILTVVSSNADTFNLTSAADRVTRTCLVASGNGNTTSNTGGGCTNGAW